ncbi:MAG: hypothetical protein P4L22_05955 [Candidatus Babeliales bacterium]|nr:hypothetical protein [Candidatus Babeliales bacterium]
MVFKKIAILLVLLAASCSMAINCSEDETVSSNSASYRHRGIIVVLNGSFSEEKKDLCANLNQALTKKNSKSKKAKKKWCIQTVPHTSVNEVVDAPNVTERDISNSGQESDYLAELHDSSDFNMIKQLHQLANNKFNIIYNTFLNEAIISTFINELENGGYRVCAINIQPRIVSSEYRETLRHNTPSPAAAHDFSPRKLMQSPIPSAVRPKPESLVYFFSFRSNLNNTETQAVSSAQAVSSVETDSSCSDYKPEKGNIKNLLRRHSSGGSSLSELSLNLAAICLTNIEKNETPRFKYALVLDKVNSEAVVIIVNRIKKFKKNSI